MNALTPFERLDDLFPEMFRRFMRPAAFGTDVPSEIRVDVTENDAEYVLRAEIPGAKKDDIRVAIDGNRLSISAEVKKEQEEKSAKGRVLLRETTYGSVSRGFTLAHEIDDKAATAKFEDGVLKLTLPKRADAGNRLLSIT